MTAKSRLELIIFTILVFAALWIPCGLLIFAPDATNAFFTSVFGDKVTVVNFIVLGAYSPSLAGIILTVTMRGVPGIKDLFVRLFRWRANLIWWLLAFFVYPVAFLLSHVVGHYFLGRGPVEYNLFFQTLPVLIATGFLFQDSGPLGEEIGIRGFALPRMLEQWSPFWASLILGAVWSLWHLPAFFLGGIADHAHWSFWVFLLIPVGISFFMTLIHINSRGSIILSGIIPHMMVNAMNSSGIEPEVTPEMTSVIMVVGLVAIVIGGKRFFKRSDDVVFLAQP